MKSILVWDLLTRLFHWSLVVVFAGAAGIALLTSHHSPLFQTHMMFGLVAAFLVVLRIIWGFVGTRYARFRSFLFPPRELFAYVRGAFRRTAERTIGHNPGSAYAIYGMILAPLGLAPTGLLTHWWKWIGDVHQVLAYLLFAAVAAHIAGLVWHTIRHRENIAWSMVDGKKQGDPSDAIGSQGVVAGAVFVALAAGWALLVFHGHDASKSELTLFGQTIGLGAQGDDEPAGKDDARPKGHVGNETTVEHAHDD